MNLGILSTLMHTLPYQFSGLRTIAAVLYVADLVVFILCCTFMSLRFIVHGKTAWNEITNDVNELCFMACFPISFMTLTGGTALIVSTSNWGGYAFTVVSYVMWWIVVVWCMVFGVGIYVILTLKNLTESRNLTLAIILPAVATSTAAVEGGIVSVYGNGITARMAVPAIIVGFMLVGVGFLLGMTILALFLNRILANSWFDGIKRPTLMMLLGPTCQSTAALLILSMAASMHFPEYNKGTFLHETTATALHGACVLLALMILGLGIFWGLWGVYGIMDAVVRGDAKWTPAWYSSLFPTGTLNTALTLFAEEFDSPAFRVLSAGLLILLTMNAIVNAAYTIRAIAKRQILIVREDTRKKKEG
jgi:tellurite resistance protein TehA-like permease